MAPKSPAVVAGPTCCPGGLSGPVPRDQAADLALLFRALAEPARLQLLSLLSGSESGERCACDLTGPLGLTQPTVSHHLKVLTQAGLITRTQRGTWAWFRIAPSRFAQLATILADLGSPGLGEGESGVQA